MLLLDSLDYDIALTIFGGISGDLDAYADKSSIPSSDFDLPILNRVFSILSFATVDSDPGPARLRSQSSFYGLRRRMI
ncbi:hypothetical protein CPB84DRAFT_1796407 [Gymnopilus junonius]|uniref:Uncharacterized protein n=1 Tax=Gymnopilus junonius TaxID=109634 RepID=A0A9P5TFR9_GYMJU|nr:hypothetical protein CPB84DRAFT_1796407 [Gymnopilus junonius]